MKYSLKNKLWLRIFLRIAVIFAVFVAVLTVSNRVFLLRFFKENGKTQLREQGKKVAQLDFNDSDSVVSLLSQIGEEYSFETEIYTSEGKVLYTSYGSQMIDYYYKGSPNFSMHHKPLNTVERERLSDGSVFEIAVDTYTDTEYLIYRQTLSEGLNAEIRLQMSMLNNSAQTANKFITIVALFCLAAALVWTFVWIKQFSRPITEMSEITRDMADLKFDRRVCVTSEDEIGILASSINDMSEKLSETMENLTKTNAQLRDEIELERQLDVMRRGFVANVSHELKTPISIIQGYAEGLKMNINTASREKYCDTIIDESNRMNRLVLDLLKLSRYESGQIPINRENFSLTKMASEIQTRVFADTDIKTKCPENEFLVNADPTQIEQVFVAILENAKAHVNCGGKVEISFIENSNEITVEIFNTGSHIEEEKMPQIWQSFFRGEESHKRSESRFGLGLSIVSAICRMHGKNCGVYNREDGVTFWFTLDKCK